MRKGYVLLLGDFNARTGNNEDVVTKEGSKFINNDCSETSYHPSPRNTFDNLTNSNGKTLLDLCKAFDLKILNGRCIGDSFGHETYHGKNGGSTVDYIITDQSFMRYVKYFIVDKSTFLSDHSPICSWIQTTLPSTSQINDQMESLDSLQSLPSQFIWGPNSKDLFKAAISSPVITDQINAFLLKDLEEIQSDKSVNMAVKMVESILNKAARMSLKLKQKKQKKKRRFCHKKWFDFECKTARKELRQLSNQKHYNPSNSIIRKMYHKKLKDFKNLLKAKKRNFHSQKLKELEENSENSNFWKVLNSANDEITEEIIPPIREQKWINHFTSLHSKKETTPEQKYLENNLFQMEKLSSPVNNFLNCEITEKEIVSCSKMLKNKKAASSDKIRNEMIKNSIDIMRPVYLKLFNLILKSGFFPDSWCESSLTPIFKSGEQCDPNNYRGISVSSCLGKFFMVILNQRFLKYIQKENLLHNSQIGFLPLFRTSDHIFTIRCIIDRYVTNTSCGRIYACFIDFKKAFDSVWHEGLLIRLLQNNINGKFYELIKNLYSKSNCYIKLGSRRTRSFNYLRGVRQGCILSPLLFNLYLNELSFLLDNATRTDPIILPNGCKLSHLLYADDLVLLSKSREGLQNCINSVSDFCTKWQMTVNEKKSKVMIFSKKRFKQNPTFTFNRKEIQTVQEFTYLGVKMSNTGNFSGHLTQTREKAPHAFYKVTRTVDFKKLKPKQANKLFDSLISPILTYACDVWGVYQKQSFEKWEKSPTEKMHLRFCKYYLGVNSRASNIACRAELGRFPMKIFIDKLIFKYYNHLLSLPKNSVTKQVLLMSKFLFERQKPCYLSNLSKILEIYNINDSINLQKPFSKTTLRNFYKKMTNEYINSWGNKLQTSSKLKFYRLFNDRYQEQKYLQIISNFEQRKQFTKFRISNHQLAIETGRYQRNRIEVNQRICIFCDRNETETEEHLLYNCPFYDNLRNEFFQRIDTSIPVNDIEISTCTKEIMNFENQNVYYVSKFIYKCFQLRQNIDNT